jgi:hypothetical protein
VTLGVDIERALCPQCARTEAAKRMAENTVIF